MMEVVAPRGLKDGMNTKLAGVGVGISLGVCFGVALGTATQSVAVGVALGVALGVAFALIFGSAYQASAGNNAAADKPLPHPLGLLSGPTGSDRRTRS